MTDETYINDDNAQGDNVDGDKITVGNIADSNVAIGRGASVQVHHYPPPTFPLRRLPRPTLTSPAGRNIWPPLKLPSGRRRQK